MRAIPFFKMHGLGNDFVVLDGRATPLHLDEAAVRRIGDRHRGVGFDQLVLLEPAAGDHVGIVFFNSDGSTAGACGNGTRCAARFIMDQDGRDEVTFKSAAGTLTAARIEGGRVRVLMPAPRLEWRDIPLAQACDTLALPIDLPELGRPVGVSMGNPHVVFFTSDLDAVEVEKLGPALERHPLFPERANIGFAQVVDRHTIRLRVFERGAGLTLACGSGACAAMVAAMRRDLVSDRCRLLLDGGELEIDWPGQGPVGMTGPAAYSFEGVLADEVAYGA